MILSRPGSSKCSRFLARGQKNAEIAGWLSVSERTVKFHVSSLMHKLGAENRTEAVTLAAQRGLIRLTD